MSFIWSDSGHFDRIAASNTSWIDFLRRPTKPGNQKMISLASTDSWISLISALQM